MKTTTAVLALAGLTNALPRAQRPEPDWAHHFAVPWKPHAYHHHHNVTFPSNPSFPNGASSGAGSFAAGAKGVAFSPSPSNSAPYHPPSSTAAATFQPAPSAVTPTPVSPAPVSPTPVSPTPVTPMPVSSFVPASSAAPSATSVSSVTTAATTGKVQAAGINISGCDFGCDTSGNCADNSDCPLSVGPTQMQHFSSQDGLNIFRLPVGWQYLVNNQLGGPLDSSYFSGYDGLVQSCLKTNSRCIIDIHNYARWNGQIVGQSQGGPTNEDLANLWSQLATKYAANSNVVFGVMNEPHDLDINEWAATVQAVVTAIRKAGATTQWILLPGTAYTSAGGFQTSSAPALSNVTNPDGSIDNLIYDVHNYYDSDSSGTNAECVTDHVSDRFQPLGDYLRQQKRQAFVSELGGGNTASCENYVCSSLDFLNSYSDVYLGWTGWAAGSFETSYTLSEVPTGNTDTALVSQCIAGKFKSA